MIVEALFGRGHSRADRPDGFMWYYALPIYNPFEELRTIFRRGEKADEILSAGPISIDPARHEVRVAGKEVHLTNIEFKLLRTLMQLQGRVAERDRLLNEVWGHENVIDPRTLNVHMQRLRKKLGKARESIVAVRGFGYRLRQN